jgi:hypothetical protein
LIDLFTEARPSSVKAADAMQAYIRLGLAFQVIYSPENQLTPEEVQVDFRVCLWLIFTDRLSYVAVQVPAFLTYKCSSFVSKRSTIDSLRQLVTKYPATPQPQGILYHHNNG